METLLEALIRFYAVDVRNRVATDSTVKTGVESEDQVPGVQDLRRTFPYLP
jgi:hypothetical protein